MLKDFGGLMVAILIFGLGFASLLSASNIESTRLNWAQHRCSIFTMVTAFLYKPPDLPQSGFEFAKENFAFCMNQNIDVVARSAFAPLFIIFEQLANTATFMQNLLNTLRVYVANKMKSFSVIVEERFYKFVGIFDKFRVGYAKMQMAAGRINAIILALLFQGMSGIRLLLNLKDLIVKIVLIIMAILVALCVFAFFLVAPFIPVVIAPVLGALSGIGVYVAGSDAFCLHPDTQVVLANGAHRRISEIQLGDELRPSYTTYIFPNQVTGILEVDGSTTQLYNYKGIYLSGTHRVLDKGHWKLARDCTSAHRTKVVSGRLFILNTAHHWVPVQGTDQCVVGDWEEVNDFKGQLEWIHFVEKTLNGQATRTTLPNSIPLLGPDVKVKTTVGWKAISQITIGDSILDVDGTQTPVLGTYRASSSQADTDWLSDGNWVKGPQGWELYSEGRHEHTRSAGNSFCHHCITGSGSFLVQSNGTEFAIRDFTECGWKNLENCYDVLDSVLEPRDF